MNLDELEQKIRAVSTDSAVQGVADQLAAWSDGSVTGTELIEAVERYIGNVWIASNSDHEAVYAIWSDFRKSVLTG